ncbi:Uncharacterized conserved protein YbjT, contains NAD(P)-binding and DUF2867 domains [Geodermatophilus telluris]|uniref:Uncharacterized conserved protein YbjT, contains NAD(P)-binding and DUF2867 domains n=1 Tax=Geodermatophilus telluris TaxID=1190417 RepID=A0A1G6UF47_9ACTN|nr:NAD(P)H-binding protein [Geodermatophilus telluris]SDD39923.1 Uncharacterized conserved protein YbjT, contains NAD(P)-binding and DUF2867 domains [Geodermatophilus telluris]
MPDPVIAVFGAAGKTGRAVVRALLERGLAPASVRRLVRDGPSPPAPFPGVPSTAVDLEVGESVTAAVAGATALYVVAPNLHPDEPAIVGRAVAAAREHGIERIVHHSVLRPGLQAMPHHWGKLRAEELLWGSGLDVTVLQPSAYVQNLVPAVTGGELVVPYSVDRPFSLVDLADVADVAARVLTGSGHTGATYELAGPTTTVAALARDLGLAARRRREPPGDGASDGYGPRALQAMFDWYDRHGLAGSPGVLRWLLGREPRHPAEVLSALASGRAPRA